MTAEDLGGTRLVASGREQSWPVEYSRFLARMATKYPREFFRRLVSWNMYAFFPGRTRRAVPRGVVHYGDVDAAVAAFARDGFVIVSDALTAHETEALHSIVKKRADEIVRKHQEHVLPAEAMHGRNRYSWGEYGHNPEWEHVGRNERIIPILRKIWSGHDFRAVAAGGDFVLPGGEFQSLHTDLAWHGAGEAVPRILIVNYLVSEVLPTSGPIRMIPGTARFPVPPFRVFGKREPEWMKRSVATGRPGYAIIRDPRGWHGGTPNTSAEPRYMPAIEFVMNGAPDDQIESTVALDQLSRGQWIAEFSNA